MPDFKSQLYEEKLYNPEPYRRNSQLDTYNDSPVKDKFIRVIAEEAGDCDFFATYK